MASTGQDVLNNDKSKESYSLEDILSAFNNPVNEEQAWSVCYQCAQYFQNSEKQSLDCRLKYHELYKYGKRAVKFSKDGSVFIEYSEIIRGTGKGPPKLQRKNSVTGKDIKIVTENDAIQALGLVIYQALDYGLGDNEERHLGRDLEHLLELMINPDEDDETFTADDEGIEKDAKEGCTFQEITVLCVRHLTNQQDAGYHYKAVCRALAAEAAELTTFLDKVTRGSERLAETQLDQDLRRLDDLQRADWARLWVQMMRELRQGCRLKKVDYTNLPPVEYELTPFEILLEDIRTRRYSLNKIMVNGDIPNKVKCDAHAVMLDFIRSRPPLQPAKDRVLKSPPKRELTAREQILLHIRQNPPKLKSVSDGRHIVETSRTKLDNDDDQEDPQPVRKVIKPDFNLLLDSFEDDDDDDGTLSPKSRRSSLASPSPEREVPHWRRTVVRDVVTQERHNLLQRRNTITVCESPQVLSPEDEPHHREHESKLKRTGPVSKSNACPNDLRKRLNEKLHGCSSVSRLHSRRMHGSISEVPSENENSESKSDKKTESVKNESQFIRSVRRVSSSRSSSHSSLQNTSTDSTIVPARTRHSSHRMSNKSESETNTQNSDNKQERVRVQRRVSGDGTSNRTVQRATSHRIRRQVSTEKQSEDSKPNTSDETGSRRPRPSKIIIPKSEDNKSNTSHEIESPRPRSPRIVIPKQSVLPVSQSSPVSPGKMHVSMSFAGLTELSTSPIKMHASKQMHDNACSNESDNSDISLGKSLPSRRILVSRRSSMPVSKSCSDLEEDKPTTESLQRTQSVLDIESERPRPKPRPRLSKRNSLTPTSSENNSPISEQTVPKSTENNENVPSEKSDPQKPVPRPRTKLVQRSKSQRPVVRHSTDFSELSAINSPRDSMLENRIDSGAEKEKQKTLTPARNFRSETPDPSNFIRSESPALTQLSELDVNELLNVSLNTPSVQELDTNNSSTTPCQDSRSDSKWNHPIECLSLNLEEVMHIRTVLTKAELESHINQPEFYNLLSKGKVCFTCKEVKFSMFGQWGNRCKICKRNICNTCLRKMNIPTEHFQNIPVHTLSPIPLSQEALDILKVFESTGSVPHSPLSQRKLLQEMEKKSPRKKSLQRSQTFNSSPNLASTLPNKNLLKGPQMNVCCECKKMIMDIIRTSRTSIALINKTTPPKDNSPEKKSPLSTSSLSLSVKNFFTQK